MNTLLERLADEDVFDVIVMEYAVDDFSGDSSVPPSTRKT